MEIQPKDNCTTSSVKEDRVTMELEVDRTAAVLFSLTYLEVDRKTAEDLEKERHEAIHATLIRHRPWLPPVPSVTRFMGKCSKAISKQLEDSDVKDNQSRLALKKDYVLREYLPMLNKSNEIVRDGIEVIAYDSYGNKYEHMVFKVWGHKMYVFTRQWKQFGEDYKLIPVKDEVKVWMFRDKHTERLCAVIMPILDLTVSIASRIAIRQELNRKDK